MSQHWQVLGPQAHPALCEESLCNRNSGAVPGGRENPCGFLPAVPGPGLSCQPAADARRAGAHPVLSEVCECPGMPCGSSLVPSVTAAVPTALPGPCWLWGRHCPAIPAGVYWGLCTAGTPSPPSLPELCSLCSIRR